MIMIIAKVKELLYLLNYDYHIMDHYNNINNNNDNNNSNNNNNKSCTITSADLNQQIKL